MKYSTTIKFKLDNMFNLYWSEFGHKLDTQLLSVNKLRLDDERISYIPEGFLISCQDVPWPIESLTNALELEIENKRLFVTNPGMKLPIHRDCVGETKKTRSWAINVPICNCNLGTNEWFDDNNDFGKEQIVLGGSAITPEYLNNEYVVSESSVLDGIKLLRTDVMHRSNNVGNPKRRVVLSLRGSADIEYEQIKEKIIKLNEINC